jgi:hypothetical protein
MCGLTSFTVLLVTAAKRHMLAALEEDSVREWTNTWEYRVERVDHYQLSPTLFLGNTQLTTTTRSKTITSKSLTNPIIALIY